MKAAYYNVFGLNICTDLIDELQQIIGVLVIYDLLLQPAKISYVDREKILRIVSFLANFCKARFTIFNYTISLGICLRGIWSGYGCHCLVSLVGNHSASSVFTTRIRPHTPLVVVIIA